MALTGLGGDSRVRRPPRPLIGQAQGISGTRALLTSRPVVVPSWAHVRLGSPTDTVARNVGGVDCRSASGTKLGVTGSLHVQTCRALLSSSPVCAPSASSSSSSHLEFARSCDRQRSSQQDIIEDLHSMYSQNQCFWGVEPTHDRSSQVYRTYIHAGCRRT